MAYTTKLKVKLSVVLLIMLLEQRLSVLFSYRQHRCFSMVLDFCAWR